MDIRGVITTVGFNSLVIVSVLLTRNGHPKVPFLLQRQVIRVERNDPISRHHRLWVLRRSSAGAPQRCSDEPYSDMKLPSPHSRSTGVGGRGTEEEYNLLQAPYDDTAGSGLPKASSALL
jgi:hypothetical protein